MPWSTIASNQTVSLDNLKDAVATGVFTQKTTIPTGLKQITKAEAEAYVNINTISGKTSNQLVVKSNLVASSLVTYYELAQCPGGFGYQFTAIVPNLGVGQRYVLPSGSPVFYITQEQLKHHLALQVDIMHQYKEQHLQVVRKN